MIDKLVEVEKRYEEVNELVCNPDIVSDQEKYTALMKELKHLTPVVEKFREYKKAEESFEESKMMLDDGGMDADFAQMVKEEFEQSKEDMERISEELKVLLLPRDPNDDKNVIIEIRGGAGGEESALFAGVLYRMYSMYAESKGFKTEVLGANETGLGGYKEISFSVEGDGAYSRFKFESGVHRVQRLIPSAPQVQAVSTSTKHHLQFVSRICRQALLLNARMSVLSIKIRKKHLRFCVHVFTMQKKQSTMQRLPANVRLRSAQVTEVKE